MRRKEQGQVLLVALMVLALLVILGTAGLTLATSSKQAPTGELDRTQALYAANAGIDKALLLLKADPLWEDAGGTELAGDFKDTSGKTVAHIDSVKVTTEATSWDRTVKTIVAQASAGRARKTVTVEAEINAAPFTSYSGPGLNIVPEDSSASLTLENGTQVHTDLLYTGETLTFAAGHGCGGNWRAIVGSSDPDDHRTVRATGTVVFDPSGGGGSGGSGSGGSGGGGGSTYVVYGYVYASAFSHSDADLSKYISDGWQRGWDPDIPDYPDIDLDTYRQAAKLMDALNFPGGTHYLAGPCTISLSDSMQGLYFIDGAVTLTGGSYSHRVTIVARDGITVQGNIAKSGGALSLVTPSNIIVNNGAGSVEVTALLFAGGTLVVNRDATLTGGVNARGLAEEEGGKGKGKCCGKNVEVTFEEDSDAANQMPPGFPVTVKVISWKE
ncbi:MAG: hypothetical protein AB1374_12340 [Bacillota bacterium]